MSGLQLPPVSAFSSGRAGGRLVRCFIALKLRLENQRRDHRHGERVHPLLQRHDLVQVFSRLVVLLARVVRDVVERDRLGQGRAPDELPSGGLALASLAPAI